MCASTAGANSFRSDIPATGGDFFCLSIPQVLTCNKQLFIVCRMNTATNPVTTAEYKAAYRRAGLWRIGMTFDAAMAAPLVRWAMEKSALAERRSGKQQPVQLRLI